VTVSLTWAFVVIFLRFRDFLTLHDTVSKRNPEITVPIHTLRMSAIVVQRLYTYPVL
jgi:hypothetical protein